MPPMVLFDVKTLELDHVAGECSKAKDEGAEAVNVVTMGSVN